MEGKIRIHDPVPPLTLEFSVEYGPAPERNCFRSESRSCCSSRMLRGEAECRPHVARALRAAHLLGMPANWAGWKGGGWMPDSSC